MFGKFFASAFTGSLRGKGAEYFAVLGYIVSHTAKDHLIDLNPADVADRIGMSREDVGKVIDYFCQKDGQSRSPDHEGRRLIQQGTYQYFVVNHERYRAIRDMDDYREYNRLAKQKERAKKKPRLKPDTGRGPTADEMEYDRIYREQGRDAADDWQDRKQK